MVIPTRTDTNISPNVGNRKEMYMFKRNKKKELQEEFYTLDRLDQEAPDAKIRIIAGEKGNGKSYAAKIRALNHWRDTNARFVYLRRFDSDCTATKIERIFSDIKEIEAETGGYNFIGAYAGSIYAHKLDHTVPVLKRADGVVCGYYGSIQKIIRSYSSIPFPVVDVVLMDEVSSTDGAYLENEAFLFDICLSTILRRNQNATVYIIGNTWDRNCPYYRKYGIDISTIDQDTIYSFDYQNADNTKVRIALERCKDLAVNNNPLIVTGRDSIISGKWYEEPQPILENPKDYKTAYTFYVDNETRLYKCQYLVRGMDSVIYVSEYDESDYPENARIITKRVSLNALQTPKLYPLTQEEGLVFQLIKMGKVMYSDNLTGTEFQKIIKRFI